MLIEIALGIVTISLVSALGYAAEKHLTNFIGFGPATGSPLHASLTAAFYLVSLVVAMQFFSDSPSYVFMGMLCLMLTLSSLLAHLFAGRPKLVDSDSQ